MARFTLTIGGSDTWGGGGIQTDLKTFENLTTFGLSVLTCIAVEKENEFVIRNLDAKLVEEQLETIEKYYKLDAVKIGLLGNVEIIEVVKAFCQRNAKQFPIILDPVMAFKESEHALKQTYLQKLIELFPFADLITPNLIETQLLLGGISIQTKEDIFLAAEKLSLMTKRKVLLKAGATHGFDLYQTAYFSQLFEGPISNKKTVNGAGCCLSAAICAYLAQGASLLKSIEKGKKFVYEAIETCVVVGEAGNVWHPTNERSFNK